MHEDLRFFSPPPAGTPLTLCCAGWSYCDGSYRIRRPAPGDLYVFEFVTAGRGTLQSGDEECSPQAGDCYVAPGRVPHEYFSSASEPWVKCWMNVTGPLAENLLELYGLAGRIHFPQAREAGEYLLQTVNLLLETGEREAPFLAAERLHHFIRLLAQFLQSSAKPLSSGELAARRLHDELQRLVARPLPDLGVLCRKLGFSQLQLTRTFRRLYGTTPYAFLLDRKVAAAAELLSTTALSIKEVSRTLGFQDEYYFSRLFRQRQGLAPGRFRQQNETLYG